MSEQSDGREEQATRDLDYEQARLAYSIIESLLEHTRVVSDLIALMAQVLDEDTTRALTNTPHWKAYLDSRDRKSTRLNSSHANISYAVFCLKKKKQLTIPG